MTTKLESTKVPAFSGKREDFHSFAIKFRNYAREHEFFEVLKPRFDLKFGGMTEESIEAEGDAADGHATRVAAVKLNNKAMRKLLSSMPNKELGRLEMLADDEEGWEEGLFSKAWSYIEDKYRMSDRNAELKLSEELSNLRMKKGSDPRDLFEKLNEIEVKYHKTSAVFNDARKISTLKHALSEEYLQIMKVVTVSQEAAGNEISLEEVEKQVVSEYESKKAAKTHTKGIEYGLGQTESEVKGVEQAVLEMIEKAQNTTSGSNSGGGSHPGVKEIVAALVEQMKSEPSGGRQRICYRCGESGHLANTCPNPPNPEKVNGLGIPQCNVCGNLGHTDPKCWCLPANATMRPEGWEPRFRTGYPKKGNRESPEVMAAMVEGKGTVGVDIFCSAVGSVGSITQLSEKYPEEPDLRDPTIWIGDSGSSSNSSYSDEGAVNKKKLKRECAMSGFAGAPAGAEEIMTIPTEKIDMSGNKSNVWMQDVLHSPNSNYNLCSLTRLMRLGWKMKGDHESGITMTSPTGQHLKFDMKVHTTMGLVWVGKFVRRKVSPEEVAAAMMVSDETKSDEVEADYRSPKEEKESNPNSKKKPEKLEKELGKTEVTDGVSTEEAMRVPDVSEVSLKAEVQTEQKGGTEPVSLSAVNTGQMVVYQPVRRININKAHGMFAHMGSEAVREICKHLNWEVVQRTFVPCDDCAVAKAKTKPLLLTGEHVKATPEEGVRIFVDTSSSTQAKIAKDPRPFWIMAVEEQTEFKESMFAAKKSELPNLICAMIVKWRKLGVKVRYVRLDDAGENKTFAMLANGKDWNLNLIFEFTGADEPRANYLVEKGFGTLWGRVRAMMSHAKVPKKEAHRLWREAAQYAAIVDGCAIIDLNGKKAMRSEHLFGKKPKFVDHIRTWGEYGVLKTIGTVKPKLKQRGMRGLLVGHAEEHGPDVYRMYTPGTNRIHQTRHVQWMKRLYFEESVSSPDYATDSVVVTRERKKKVTIFEEQIDDDIPVEMVYLDRSDGDDSQSWLSQSAGARLQDGDWTESGRVEPVTQEEERPPEQRTSNSESSRTDEVDGTMEHTNELGVVQDNSDGESEHSWFNPDEEVVDSREEEDDVASPSQSIQTPELELNFDDMYDNEDGESEDDDESEAEVSNNSRIDSSEQPEEESSIDESSEESEPSSRLRRSKRTPKPRDMGAFVTTFEDDESNFSEEETDSEDSEAVDEIAAAMECLTDELLWVPFQKDTVFPEGEKLSNSMREVMCVGAGVGGGIAHTTQLHVKKYNEVMKQLDAPEWCDEVAKEHGRMMKDNVWMPVPRWLVPTVIPITTTWAMKHKASGARRARVNARGFEQKPHLHYDPDSKAAPVSNKVSIRMMYALRAAAKELWQLVLADVKGAFLKGEFQEGEAEVYIEVPQGFTHIYEELERRLKCGQITVNQMRSEVDKICKEWEQKERRMRNEIMMRQRNPRSKVSGIVLKLLRTLYGLVQSSASYFRETLKAMKFLGYKRSKADSCVHYKWKDGLLHIWLTWVDDCAGGGPSKSITLEKEKLMEVFNCEDLGVMDEYVGSKVDFNEDTGKMRITCPMILQSFGDEFGVKPRTSIRTPAKPGSILTKAKSPDEVLSKEKHKMYRTGVGKLSFLGQWSRVEISNPVRAQSRYSQAPTEEHYDAMLYSMTYCVSTPNRGLTFQARENWDGTRNKVFRIHGESDAAYAQCPDTARGTSGILVFVDDMPIVTKSHTQDRAATSVTESEFYAMVECAQDMLYVRQAFEGVGLKVEYQMILWVDNTGAKDIANGWTTTGRTRHLTTKANFLRELKEAGIIVVKYKPGNEQTADVLTKNLPRREFEKHIKKLVGDDEYMMEQEKPSNAEVHGGECLEEEKDSVEGHAIRHRSARFNGKSDVTDKETMFTDGQRKVQ